MSHQVCVCLTHCVGYIFSHCHMLTDVLGQAGKIHGANHDSNRQRSIEEDRSHPVDDMGSLLSSDEFRKLQLEVERLGEREYTNDIE